MDKILIFAGTTEGRRLAEYLNRYQVMTHVCVATAYGEELMMDGEYIRLHTGRLTREGMLELMKEEGITLVIDATHPYAAEVSANISQACQESGIQYIRLLRKALGPAKDCICVDTVQEAAEYLKDTKGRVLVTTGSKELAYFTRIPYYERRIYARVLPTPEVMDACKEMGIGGSHLLCMQGPFSEELNTALLRQIGASWLVTKESGRNGGYLEKLGAARKAGAKVLLIGRPKQEENSLDEDQVRALLCKRLQIRVNRTITLVGIGMGDPDNMTLEAKDACKEADVLIGAKRMLEGVRDLEKSEWIGYKPEEIKAYVWQHPEYENVAILLSGDVGFYSGAKRLLEIFDMEDVRIISGISSLVYFCGRLGTPWEDVKLVSLHGRAQNIIGAVKQHKKVFALVGKKDGIKELCEKFLFYGMNQVRLSVGEELSYPQEQIRAGTPIELKDQEFETLSVVLIENEAAKKIAVHGIADEDFLREKVPMTKAEVRSISLSKLQLQEDSIAYDVGAGTGSVSVEMALRAVEGRVYAIEKKSEAVELIHRNKVKFAADNLVIQEGLAPEALEELPAPTHVFIGGSSGNLKEILQTVFKKNAQARIVINAIALETVAEALKCVKELDVTDVDMVSVSIGKSKEVGKYHMMMGQNPVYIISFKGGVS